MIDFHIDFTPEAKVWVYQSSRGFTADEIHRLNKQLAAFAKQWTAHNNQLHAAGKVIEDRFILLMVDTAVNDASGCSIDKSVHFIKSLESELHVDLFNRTIVNYKIRDKIHTTTISQLQELISAGEINNETPTYNSLVQTKKEFDEEFITPLRHSWLKQFVKV
ncbi:MAG: ABC transporter ATPase [Chitinophagales bacterium]|nr:ABC transporter ATPase [Chitinophagales bacterium]